MFSVKLEAHNIEYIHQLVYGDNFIGLWDGKEYEHLCKWAYDIHDGDLEVIFRFWVNAYLQFANDETRFIFYAQDELDNIIFRLGPNKKNSIQTENDIHHHSRNPNCNGQTTNDAGRPCIQHSEPS